MTHRPGAVIAAVPRHRRLLGARSRLASVAAIGLVVITVSAWLQPAQPAVGFDAEAALRYARAQVAFGPRVPGTTAAERAGDWIVAQMRERSDTVIVQCWTHTTARGRSVPMRNIFARIRPERTERVLYVAHWDTRPVADNEQDADMRDRPGDGANDGASGVGMLMALADALKRMPPSVGVDILFVDGEDYGTFGPDVDVVVGAAYFAANLPVANYRPVYGVVWDMIGDTDLRILKERNSLRVAPQVVERVWGKAAALGYGKHFVETTGSGVMDDHVPLQRLGWAVIDVIDLDYPYHHTTGDTIDKLSVRSLRIVGEVALALVR